MATMSTPWGDVRTAMPRRSSSAEAAACAGPGGAMTAGLVARCKEGCGEISFPFSITGSSSGSAAAVAARMIPAALGSQTGGSTLRPASYCGIVGLKPTYGRISRYGVIPVSWCLDHVGILVRSVQDAALVLQAIAGHDLHDASSLSQPVGDYSLAVQQADTPPRLGVLRDFFRDHADAETQQHTAVTVERLARAGASVREVPLPPSYTTVLAAHRMIMKVEAAAFHADMFRTQREQYGPRLRETIEMGLVIPSVDYLRAQRLRRLFQQPVEAIPAAEINQPGHFPSLDSLVDVPRLITAYYALHPDPSAT